MAGWVNGRLRQSTSVVVIEEVAAKEQVIVVVAVVVVGGDWLSSKPPNLVSSRFFKHKQKLVLFLVGCRLTRRYSLGRKGT